MFEGVWWERVVFDGDIRVFWGFGGKYLHLRDDWLYFDELDCPVLRGSNGIDY